MTFAARGIWETIMRFGLFYEHQSPRPWAKDSDLRLLDEALEQIELADKLGIDYVWEVEHHFLEEYSHSSAPEVFLAACTQRTKNIRLGHGIVQAAPQYNHPARVAERIATLDLLSRGRVEFGSGESSSAAELEGFGLSPAQKQEAYLEGLTVALRCMREEPFTGFEGKHVQMPRRNVVPKPYQAPHPPLWMACSRRESILRAAQLGMGALTFAFVDPEEAADWVQDYQKSLAEVAIPVGMFVNHDIACVTPMMCHEDESEALRRGMENANFFGYSLAHYYVFGDHRPARTNLWQEFLSRGEEKGYDGRIELAAKEEVLGAKVASGESKALRGAIGTPQQIRDYLLRYEQAGVDQVIFVQQTGNSKHEHIMEALELFAKEVLPEFKERDEKQRRLKAERLAPAVAAAMARKPKEMAVSDEDYVIEPLVKRVTNSMAGRSLETIAKESARGNLGIGLQKITDRQT